MRFLANKPAALIEAESLFIARTAKVQKRRGNAPRRFLGASGLAFVAEIRNLGASCGKRRVLRMNAERWARVNAQRS